jgi:hypothetical protein
MVKTMHDVSQPPRSSDPSRRPSSSPLIDLIAFLGVLALGVVLMALGHATAGSIATTCAALGALYGVWKRFGSSGGSSSSDDQDNKPDENPQQSRLPPTPQSLGGAVTSPRTARVGPWSEKLCDEFGTRTK